MLGAAPPAPPRARGASRRRGAGGARPVAAARRRARRRARGRRPRAAQRRDPRRRRGLGQRPGRAAGRAVGRGPARAPRGSIRLFGRDVSSASPRARRALGLHFVPEERIGRGSVPALPLAREHAAHAARAGRRAAAGCTAAARGGWRRASSSASASARAGPRRRPAACRAAICRSSSSGREVDAAPKVLMVGAADLGPRRRRRRADPPRDRRALRRGRAPSLVVSEDLEELFELCDRPGRHRARAAVAAHRRARRDAALIGQWMSGLFPSGGARASPVAAGVEAHA